jgi:hypothetical protein
MRPLVILALLAGTLSARAFEHAIPIVELASATQSKDGFRVEIEAVPFPANPREPGAMPLITFVTHVPLEVAKTSLGIVWLEIQGRQGQTLLEASLDRRLRGKVVRCSVDVERRLAADCVLHFQYTPLGEAGHWVKDYVVRLKYHIPKQQ